MKKNLSIREMILFGILLIAVVYYYVVQGPVAKETDALNQQIEDLQSQITFSQSRLVHKTNMEQTIEEAFNLAGGTPNEIPAYNNLNEVIVELNAILAKTEDYNVSFGEDIISQDGIARRSILIDYRCKNYEDSKAIISAIEGSTNRYLIQSESLAQEGSDSGEYYSVSLSVICYEYVW